MKVIKLYIDIILNTDLILSGVLYPKGTKGSIVDKIDEENVLVEFDYKVFTTPVQGINIKYLDEVTKK